MVSGEVLNIPTKSAGAVNKQWTVPMMMASNYYFQYKDSSQQVSRRIATFAFLNFIEKPNPRLESDILN